MIAQRFCSRVGLWQVVARGHKEFKLPGWVSPLLTSTTTSGPLIHVAQTGDIGTIRDWIDRLEIYVVSDGTTIPNGMLR